MDIYALFDDGTSNRIVYSFYDSDPGCRIKIDFPPSLSDAQVRNSADEGIVCAYHSLRRLRYIAEREDYYIRCRFDKTEVNAKALGSSAGLAFSLKFAQEIYRAKTGKVLDCSAAATGIIDETGCRVGRVNDINPKFDAAIECLQHGGCFFYPADNEEEIDTDKKARAVQKGIELISVVTVDEAIKRLLPEKAPASLEKIPIELESAHEDQKKPSAMIRTRRFFTVFILLIILPGLYFLLIKPLIDNEPPPKCQEDEFIYKKQYEASQQEYLKYLENKQHFDELQLFVKSNSGVHVPIHFARLYMTNQPELAFIAKSVRNGKTYPDKSDNKIVLIAGGPGTGKSTILKWMASPAIDPERPLTNNKIAMLDLDKSFRATNRKDDPECRQEPTSSPSSTMVDDLIINGVDISCLPSLDSDLFDIKQSATDNLNQILLRFGFLYDINGERKKINAEMDFTAIIVDSLDEVTPSSSKKLLELLRAYKKENPKVSMIAAGRGEGFRGYVHTNIESYEYHHLEPIYLSTDRLIEWRIHDWLMYHLIESEDSKGIPRSEITQIDLSSVKFDEKADELKHRLFEALNQEPWLRNFLFLLSPSNKLFSNIYYHQAQGPARDIRETWVSSILSRSCKTHNRPKSFSHSPRLNLYKKALQQAARRAKVTFGNAPSGAFSPPLSIKTPSFILTNLDDVGIEPNDETQPCIKVSTIRTLERSGFVDIFLVDGEQYNVMFFPPVAQEILAEF